MQIEKREVEASLPSKGFVRDNSGDHIYFHFMYDGKTTGIHTYVSHGARSIGDPLISAMKKQLHLNSSRDLVDLVKCPMSGEVYVQILKEKGQL